MKKLFLLLLFVSSFLFSQECKCDPQFIRGLNEMKEDQIRAFSDDLTSGFEKKQKFIKVIENEPNLIKVIFYDEDIPDNVIKKDIENGYCSSCTEVNFKRYYKGRNSDLNIKGEEFVNFVSVEGKYLDLYKWWQSHLYPTLSKEEILFTDKVHYLKIPESRIDIRFTKTLDTWEIMNKF